MNRRHFISILSVPALVSLSRATAQTGRMARVAMLTVRKGFEDEVRDQFAKLGWIEGRNLQVDFRPTDGSQSNIRSNVKELMQLRPDVIIAGNTSGVAAWLQETKTIPIVFTGVSDPMGSGFLSSMTHPGGNVTGFIANEPSLTGKWLQLLKELAPQTVRAIAVFNPLTTAGNGSFFLPSFNEGARAVGLEPLAAPIETSTDIEPVFLGLGFRPLAGIVLLPSPFISGLRAEIASAAIRNRLPTVGPYPETTLAGGLASYGTRLEDGYRAAVGYVNRILRGEKPGDLPVQTPTKFELTINLKTANALGLEVSPVLLSRADRVIE